MPSQARNVLIVVAHPEPTSFNHALTDAAARALRDDGHHVEVSDLYAQDFGARSGWDDFRGPANPSRFHYQSEQANAVRGHSFHPEIAEQQARLARADHLVLQFPIWWGSPPAVLKAWLERVLAYGFAYVDGYRFAKGLFRGRRAILSVTTGGTRQRFSEGDVYGPIENVLYPTRRLALEYMGFDVAPTHASYAAPRSSDDERRDQIAAWVEAARSFARLPTDRSHYPPDPLSLVEEGAWAR